MTAVMIGFLVVSALTAFTLLLYAMMIVASDADDLEEELWRKEEEETGEHTDKNPEEID